MGSDFQSYRSLGYVLESGREEYGSCLYLTGGLPVSYIRDADGVIVTEDWMDRFITYAGQIIVLLNTDKRIIVTSHGNLLGNMDVERVISNYLRLFHCVGYYEPICSF